MSSLAYADWLTIQQEWSINDKNKNDMCNLVIGSDISGWVYTV